MILPDVNILIYAHRNDAPDHEAYKQWLTDLIQGPSAFGLSDLVLSGFIRVVTHPRVFVTPTPLKTALEFVEQLRAQPQCVILSPGARHWSIFSDLCRASQARGNLIADAYLAALAIEAGAEWVTADRDYARFPGLNWRHPLETHRT